ncbi:Trm112 family protein [Aldersonia sp. NBC_00410]|uniref:Trm112 family protein n=1 Tax=Aldersonia sp. NBC_00410 TaxID=2975954 RepID=UPI00224CE016|nr:Trm112 family protein [Aldersonia sp. NBC_00410]MCX5046437.1 Trm112 family protein [Aldersonia sp. NBC_00410]
MESGTVVDDALLGILACPQDKGPLLLVADGGDSVLYNPRLRVAYPIESGIPALLADEARAVTDDVQHDDYLARGRSAPGPEDES